MQNYLPIETGILKFETEKDLLVLSSQDLKDDFEELKYLVDCALRRIKKFNSEILSSRKNILPQTYNLTNHYSAIIQNNFQKYYRELNKIIAQRKSTKISLELIEKLTIAKKNYFDLIRTNYHLIGTLVTSTDWQSPSFAHSFYSMAGRQTGKIKGTINDYKRDIHLDEEGFEKAYLREYIDAKLKLNIKVFMTNSGMAAFSTIFNFLLCEDKIKNKVLMGSNVYFQYKQLLVKGLKEKIIEIDEFSTENIIETIKKEKPSAIFLDSLSNAKAIPVPDLPAIIKYLIKFSKEDIYLVIDNTCLSVAFQPFKEFFLKVNKVHLLVFESLNKYAQFGLDRVTGGIIVGWGKDVGKIVDYRKHTGTNITDSSSYTIPLPKRKLLEKRLKRYQRNTLVLASYLQNFVLNSKKNLIEKVIYPGLVNHPSYSWTKHYPFQGSFFNLQFKKKWENAKNMKRFIESAISEAKKQHVDLVAGTSFGLNITRVYLTSLWTDFGEPFMRISVGTENLLEIEKLKKVFIAAIDKMS